MLGEHPAPVMNSTQRVCIRSIQGSPSVAPHRDKPNIQQNLQMFRDRRLSQLERFGNLTDRPLLVRDELEDVATARFGDVGWAHALLANAEVGKKVTGDVAQVLEGLQPAERAAAVVSSADGLEPAVLATAARSIPAPAPAHTTTASWRA